MQELQARPKKLRLSKETLRRLYDPLGDLIRTTTSGDISCRADNCATAPCPK